jgi:hypothetical protein
MSDLLAIFGPTDTPSDSDPDGTSNEGPAAGALRDRLAALMALVERRTGATVIGTAGDRDQLLGWRFDRELSSRIPVAA